MSEELQSLLDRIQADGVAKAEARAADIVSAAEKKAADIVSAAEKKAAERLAKAEADAATFERRAGESLRQAARDVVRSVRENVQETCERLLRADVKAALSGDALAAVVETVAKASAAEDAGAELRVPPAEAEKVAAHAKARLAAELAKGLKIAPDADVAAGVRVLVKNGRVEHDFTAEAVVEALSRVVRPELAKAAFG
ncbi:MAG: hypothetical protein II839_00795 [Kiritimatiellae bacterium]|nr:hypothetical protein [Kiritimatiellia bacterium]